jgi:hypothetical protein
MTILTMKDTVSLYVYYYHIVGYVLHNIKELVIGSSVILETCYYLPLTTTTSYLSNYLVLLSSSVLYLSLQVFGNLAAMVLLLDIFSQRIRCLKYHKSCGNCIGSYLAIYINMEQLLLWVNRVIPGYIKSEVVANI